MSDAHRRESRRERQASQMTRRLFLQAMGGGIGLALAGGAVPLREAHAAGAGDRGTLLIGEDLHSIRTLDPGRTIEVTGMMVEHVTYDTLITFDGEDLKTPKPLLATSWKVSGDGRAYTFALRPNVKFTSGNEFTSADVKWTLDRVLNLKANTFFLIEGVQDVLAPDPRTVVIQLKAPEPSIIPILSHPGLGILDSRLLAEKGGDAGPDAKTRDQAESYLNGHSAGSGPFILMSYTPGQELVVARNPGYWRGPARLERIIMRHIPEPATQALQVVRGDLDLAESIGQDQIAPLRRAPNVTVKTSPAATTFYVLMNNNSEVGGSFSNPKVQQAVRSALDYDGIMKIAGPGAIRLAGVIPTMFPGSLDSRDAVRTDTARARALLAESGLAPVKGKLSYASDQVAWGIPSALLAQKIQSDLAAVGITMDLDGLPIVTSLAQYRAGKNQMGVWGWAADYPDPSDFLVWAPGRVVGKRAGWLPSSSPAAQKLAALADDAESEVEPRKRVALLRQFERTLAQVGPFAPLFMPAVPYAFRSNVQGVTYHSVWAIDLYTIRKTA
jgi:peptide/nickel transport system substrate-binding protein